MRFAFGKNWQSYSQRAITPERIEQARRGFAELLGDIKLSGKRFIDIGFGQGLSVTIAAEMGADALGIDIDDDNVAAVKATQQAMNCAKPPETRVASILDQDFVEAHEGAFDIVHSWGVLHHTGNMKQAMKNACSLVNPGGYFICAIYNRHWSSGPWVAIKWLYCALPSFLQRLMILLVYPVIYVAKWIVTRENPKNKERGMDFMHDVVDWVGGYPYEYANVAEMQKMVGDLGLTCLRTVDAEVPTGCNEFVFQKPLV
ncbi:MAG: SAM-dependent methyltransferase [Rhodothermales bacterium]|jgi:SAM-dependent methyltransferase